MGESDHDGSIFELSYIQDGKEHTRRVSREQLLAEGWSELAIDRLINTTQTRGETLLSMLQKQSSIKALNTFAALLERLNTPNGFGLPGYSKHSIPPDDARELLSELVMSVFVAGAHAGTHDFGLAEKLEREIQADMDARTKTLRTSAGTQGGKNRAEKYDKLRTWALNESKNIKDSDQNIADALLGQIPKELKNISKDPWRFIYDALRQSNKGKKT